MFVDQVMNLSIVYYTKSLCYTNVLPINTYDLCICACVSDLHWVQIVYRL
ncbi:hypothetical protein Hanom_Chr06g00554871 [Helianthus anomalus]